MYCDRPLFAHEEPLKFFYASVLIISFRNPIASFFFGMYEGQLKIS